MGAKAICCAKTDKYNVDHDSKYDFRNKQSSTRANKKISKYKVKLVLILYLSLLDHKTQFASDL